MGMGGRERVASPDATRLAALRCGTSYYPDAYSFATNATQTRLRDAAVRARAFEARSRQNQRAGTRRTPTLD